MARLVTAVPESEWKWYGSPGHFILAFNCRFHMLTRVGGYIVCTIGENFPDAPVREIMAQSRGITLEGKGDARIQDYMQKIGFDPMGASDCKYETLVFPYGHDCKESSCGGCGLPKPSTWTEIDGTRWMTAAEATKGHMGYCRQYAKVNP